MQVAIIVKTKQQVEIVAIKHGWTTVRELGQSKTFKVRNSQLMGRTTMEDKIVREYKKVEAAKAPAPAKAEAAKPAAEPKEPRAKKPVEDRLNGVVYAGYLPQYEAYKTALKDGTLRRSIDKGDAVAVQLRGMELVEVYKFAAAQTGLGVSDLVARFEHLNPGMQRMNLGNMIRKVVYAAAKGAK